MNGNIKPMTTLAEICTEADKLRLRTGNALGDTIVSDIYANAEQITRKVVTHKQENKSSWDAKLDDILTSRLFGYPIMLALLGLVFWITIEGANVPSGMLADTFFAFQDQLTEWFELAGAPDWLHGVLVLGLYRGLAWVVSVMLPPMAIFFPLFTLLEDLGYLPRVAFNMDNFFKKCKACGKQALTMCMGFGCNAAGIVSCRIIDSPRERLIAILTNNFVPCNGRFPTLIAVATIFFGGAFSSEYETAIAALTITGLVLLGIATTFAVSWILSHTILKGEPSSLVLELPPYRPPQVGAIIYRSIIDRTLFVLKRAVIMAAPAGAITWILANIYIGELSIIGHLAGWLQPLGYAIGIDGFILLAFILGLPANEIVVPILLMSYLATGQMMEFESFDELRQILLDNDWTWLTAVCTMLFCLLHWPCTTTLLSAYKESGSVKWTFLSFLIPTGIAFAVCFVVAQSARLLGLA
ncbi:nucleoside recognition domain-containing protein [Sporomusa acidovorans]|uniref:Fe(2+) transporter FeoB n=1 Tax=Sporomusa acidovorans (strain ATCC 49682 / DSM 3132 / Mol) TaxID=1123286 RepID=A0ABZ3J5G9_SPOA4|nr:nucleoside recognition domain-containing protein [Sporomusa acidovorans]OZC23962.1 ferrous iron transport protein B [Sporomusa acidovorans DSM 3132]SDF32262.1 ferrous iron transport protein B [Sporomusa acidovorans]